MSTNPFVLVYLDTNLFPKYNDVESKKHVKRLKDWHLDKKITLRTTQGILDDIFTNVNERTKIHAEQRFKTVQSYTEPVAEIIFECNEDFEEEHIKLFEIMFPHHNVNSDNIFNLYNDLKSNDRNDYRIINSVIHDSHSYAFFLSNNKRDFINNGKSEELVSFVKEQYRKDIKIDTLNDQIIDQIKKAISEVSMLISK
ncbi:hypothetical protein [Alkalibacillus silvisoli]|uniref:DUF4935 domain-containing protein n=1 Tax=Alkalibacillus silvisoli TaxID=392823 RepID=A0ABP3K5W2_9BACI